MTPLNAKRLLPHLQPLVLSIEGEYEHAITPNHKCITEEKLHELGLCGDMLYEHPWYDLMETDAHGRRVHVILEREMTAYANQNGWAEEERQRKAAREKMEKGG